MDEVGANDLFDDVAAVQTEIRAVSAKILRNIMDVHCSFMCSQY